MANHIKYWAPNQLILIPNNLLGQVPGWGWAMLILGLAGSKVGMLGTAAARLARAQCRLAARGSTPHRNSWSLERQGRDQFLVGRGGPGRCWVLMLLSNNRYVVCHTHCHTVTLSHHPAPHSSILVTSFSWITTFNPLQNVQTGIRRISIKVMLS